jgi:hypothetical protein
MPSRVRSTRKRATLVGTARWTGHWSTYREGPFGPQPGRQLHLSLLTLLARADGVRFGPLSDRLDLKLFAVPAPHSLQGTAQTGHGQTRYTALMLLRGHNLGVGRPS